MKSRRGPCRACVRCGLAGLLVMFLAGFAAAEEIELGDPGFEGNGLVEGGQGVDLGPEWLEAGGPLDGSGFESRVDGFAAEGVDHLGVESGHHVWQDLGQNYQPNTRYLLAVAVGRRSGFSEAGNLSIYQLADSSGSILAAGAIDASTVEGSGFVDAPVVVFDTAANPQAVGREIRVSLRGGGNGRSHFDDVRLQALPVDIPGAAAILANPASAVGADGATLSAEVGDIGVEAPEVTFYYGRNNAGPSAESWEHSLSLVGPQSGSVSVMVDGLMPATGYHFAVRASNSAGDSWGLPAASFETAALPPTVANLAVEKLKVSSARLGAEVMDNGGDNPEVLIYYGTSDGGLDLDLWEHHVSLGSVSVQGTADVSDLLSGQRYFHRARAVNGGGEAWAPVSGEFVTGVVGLPAVSNRNPGGITGTTATLRGEIDATGGEDPMVTLFYGPVDGGKNPDAWAASAELGFQDDDFSVFVRNLLENTNYWYRARAVNSGGTVWSGDSGFFRTSGAVPSEVVINEIHYDPKDESLPGEFIELHNPGDDGIDLSGWRLGDAIDFDFPSGTVIEAGGYLVVGQDPETLQGLYGISALGPWSGRLANEGEQIDLRDDEGDLHDQVTYGAGFPWPTGARGGGGSAELISPVLDNDLGGSWRESNRFEGDPVMLAAGDDGWRFRKGDGEASSPSDEWRKAGFSEDSNWQGGVAPIGYGDGDDVTVLTDMRDGYSSIYLRNEFELAAGVIPSGLKIRIYSDDGAVVWINGTEVLRVHVPDGELSHDDSALNHEAAWEEFIVPNAGLFLVGGTNLVTVHALNATLGSSDFSIDLELSDAAADLSGAPTPGQINSIYATQAPPQIRQVRHRPESPRSGMPVSVTAKLTDPDGIGSVHLEYQLIEPGAFVGKTDPAFLEGWVSVPMLDDGSGGDLLGGDSVFTAVLPGNLQVHRRMVRYRLVFEDAGGVGGIAPWPDDEQPNFAYFVYDGFPNWRGSMVPGGVEETFGDEVLERMPAYHLLARESDVTDSQYVQAYDGVRMEGALIHDGEVYDHIEFENRGEASTYVSGKNKWRFHFNRARSFQARDNQGEAYGSKTTRLNLNACSSPWVAAHRGMAGVDEAVANRLYELCGIPSARTSFLQLRVIDSAEEVSSESQYEGDLWGLYLAVEQPSGGFLNDRELPDGSLYKIEGGAGDKKEQGLGQSADSSDWDSFHSAAGAGQSEQWWRENLNLENYYSFRACNRISGNVDLREGYNHYYYQHPGGRWSPIPWDLDMVFIPETHWSGELRAANALSHPSLALEFRNRSRELLDLMASDPSPDGGQIGQLIDEYAELVNPRGQALTWADLDARLWNYHPRTRGNPGTHSGQTNHKGNFFHSPFQDTRRGGDWTRILATPDHEGSMKYLLDYTTGRFLEGAWEVGNGNPSGYGLEYLKKEAADPEIPARPTVVASGAEGFPADDLRFSSSAFADPQGDGGFGAMAWRLAEIAAPGKGDDEGGTRRRYEVESVWETGEMDSFAAEVRIPVSEVRPGSVYRVRVRHRDQTGRWSHWSAPLEFEVAESRVDRWRDHLVVSEFSYNPGEPTGVEELSASDDSDDYEFIELRNVSLSLDLDLSELRFTEGVEFDFGVSAVSILGPGERVVVVKNLAAFEARYGKSLPVAGEFASGGLSNGGETIGLSLGEGSLVREWRYSDLSPWPHEADGDGASLVLVNPSSVPDHSEASNWRASERVGGTPGGPAEPVPGSHGAWEARHFSDIERLDRSMSGSESDPDGDGRSNLEERAFGTDPRLPDRVALELVWEEFDGVTRPAVRFPRPVGAIDLNYLLEAGSETSAWEEIVAEGRADGTAGEDLEWWVIADPSPDLAVRRFFRVRFWLSPL